MPQVSFQDSVKFNNNARPAIAPKGKSFYGRQRRKRVRRKRNGGNNFERHQLTTIRSERLQGLGLAFSTKKMTTTSSNLRGSALLRANTAPPRAMFFVDLMVEGKPAEEADEARKQLLEKKFTDGLERLFLREYADAKSLLQSALGFGVDFLGGADLIVNLVREKLGDACVHLREWDEAAEHYKRALHHLQETLGRLSEHTGRILASLGHVFEMTGDFENATLLFDEATDIQDDLIDIDEAEGKRKGTAPALEMKYDTGLLYAKLDHLHDAESFFKDVAATSMDDIQDNPRYQSFVANANNALGNVMYKKCDYREAIAYYETSIALQKKGGNKNYFDYIGTLTNLGTAYFHCKEFSNAKLQFQEAISECRKANSNENNGLTIASLWIKMGNIYTMQKEYDMAEKLFNDALKIKQQHFKNNSSHAEVLLLRHSLALLKIKRGLYDEAMNLFEDILAKRKESSDGDDLGIAKIYLDMCSLCLKQQRGNSSKIANKEKARDLCNSAEDILVWSVLPSNHPYMLQLSKLQAKL